MKKFIIIGVIVAAFLAAAFIIITLSNLGPIIKRAVNTYGPEMTKTEVRLGDVGVSLIAGTATMKDFHLGNPDGFTSKEALAVPSISVAFDRASLTQETLVIEKIELLRPIIIFEKRGRTDNFKTITENIGRSGGERDTTARGKDQGNRKGTKLLIREFIIRDGQLTVLVPGPSGRTLNATLPDIHLTNIGADRSGAAPPEIFGQIFGALYGKIISTSPGGVTGGVEKAGSTGDPRSD
jgi:uncharacterized protein involved in outer membrane biogenesis